MLMMLNFLASLLFMFLNHPMTMGLTLLAQTMVVAMITGLLNSNFWFSYILFLIMIGGLLVLFIYMTSIASNEIFFYSSTTFIMFISSSLTLIMIYLLTDNYFMNLDMIFNESWINNSTLNFNLIKYFNYPSMLMILLMIIYLFITLIAVVKITKIEHGPLRQTL